MESISKVLVVGDLHCGSRWGLTPEGYWNTLTMGMTKWLWGRWCEFVDSAHDIDLLVLNGDLIDGHQHRSDGVTNLVQSLEEQTDIAIEALAPLIAKARKTIRIVGTPYHESFDGPLGKLDATFGIKKPPEERRICHDIQIAPGVILNVKHQPEGEGTLYRGTAMDREIIWATLMAADGGIPNATHIMRSHLHTQGYIEGFGKQFALVPCWCLQSPYAQNKKWYRWRPTIGASYLARGEVGYRIEHVTYPLPKMEVESYDEL